MCFAEKNVCAPADAEDSRSAYVIVYAFVALVSGGMGFVLGLLSHG